MPTVASPVIRNAVIVRISLKGKCRTGAPGTTVMMTPRTRTARAAAR